MNKTNQTQHWSTQAKGSRMASARSYARMCAPYMMPTLYAFIPVAVDNLTEKIGGPLAVTERLVLLYDTNWVTTVDSVTLATGLVHEICHDQLRHIVRGASYPDKQKWNLAGDLFINGMLSQQMRKATIAGKQEVIPMWKIPEWAALPERYGYPNGLTADAYYRLLSKDKTEHVHMFMCGSCGSVSGNTMFKEFELQFNIERGRSEADCKNIARATSKLLQEYMEGPGRGLSEGKWSEFFDIGEESFAIPWRTKLSTVMRSGIQNLRTGGQDYSLRRPSPRSYLRGWPLPGLVSYEPEIMFIVDSSGSMGKEQIGDALRVQADIMNQCGIREAWFMEADAAAQRAPIKVTPHMLRHMEIRGRGGTDFTPAIEYAQKFRPRPSLVIYTTDGDGKAPEKAPTEFHTLWCVVPSQWGRRPANWGTLVVLDDVAELKPAS